MVRELRGDDDLRLAMLNEIGKIAAALEEISATHEFILQELQARSRRDLEDSGRSY